MENSAVCQCNFIHFSSLTSHLISAVKCHSSQTASQTLHGELGLAMLFLNIITKLLFKKSYDLWIVITALIYRHRKIHVQQKNRIVYNIINLFHLYCLQLLHNNILCTLHTDNSIIYHPSRFTLKVEHTGKSITMTVHRHQLCKISSIYSMYVCQPLIQKCKTAAQKKGETPDGPIISRWDLVLFFYGYFVIEKHIMRMPYLDTDQYPVFVHLGNCCFNTSKSILEKVFHLVIH